MHTGDTATGWLRAKWGDMNGDMKQAKYGTGERWLGLGLILLSAAAFGSTSILARLAFAAGSDTLTVLFVRFALATAVLMTIMLVKRMPLPSGRILIGLIALGMIGRAGQGVAYFTALTLAPAGLVALLLYLYPALVTLLAVIFLREKLTAIKAGAVLVALAGTALAVGPEAGGRPLGIVLGLLTAAVYAVYIIVSSHITRYAGAFVASTVIVAATALSYGGLVAVHGATWPSTALGWAAIVVMALFSTVVGTVSFFAGLQRVGPTNAATLSTFEPVVTVALAALVLGEALAPVQLVGGALILLAVLVLARKG
ncbi:MAG: Permease of the drug/metabolite transporter (DMT) superfamily [Ktedonobacterales bacterium]|nr:MAG: Permease of the drug/metabolite transporter (DMT) superfamily [Ktedonobacterales bacterium]